MVVARSHIALSMRGGDAAYHAELGVDEERGGKFDVVAIKGVVLLSTEQTRPCSVRTPLAFSPLLRCYPDCSLPDPLLSTPRVGSAPTLGVQSKIGFGLCIVGEHRMPHNPCKSLPDIISSSTCCSGGPSGPAALRRQLRQYHDLPDRGVYGGLRQAHCQVARHAHRLGVPSTGPNSQKCPGRLAHCQQGKFLSPPRLIAWCAHQPPTLHSAPGSTPPSNT